jgi:ABC-type bacteriocin/lantibiotic exporter with double-glycine peptidase domain
MKYFVQEKGYTCGCASLRMALSQFMEEVPEESVLEEEMGTNDRIGTHPDAIVRAAESRGFEVKRGEDGDFDLLDSLVAQGYAVLLMISVDVPHVVVFERSNASHVYIKDPYFGENTIKYKRKFASEKQNYPNYRWRVKSSEFKKYLPEYDFSTLESNRGWIAIKK